jgi:hypothetical protein
MARNFSHTDCPHCGAKLRIGWRTVILFLLMLASPVLAFAVVEVTNPMGLAEAPVFPFLILVIIPAVFVVSFLEWKTGRYRLDKKWDYSSEQRPGRSVRMVAPEGYEADDRRVVDRTRASHAVQAAREDEVPPDRDVGIDKIGPPWRSHVSPTSYRSRWANRTITSWNNLGLTVVIGFVFVCAIFLVVTLPTIVTDPRPLRERLSEFFGMLVIGPCTVGIAALGAYLFVRFTGIGPFVATKVYQETDQQEEGKESQAPDDPLHQSTDVTRPPGHDSSADRQAIRPDLPESAS